MYSGRTQREQDKVFILPNAKRKILFTEDEYLKEPINIATMSDYITQVAEQYPIVEYFSENTDDLNGFVNSISVAVICGQKVGFEYETEQKVKPVDEAVIAYVIDSFNEAREIYFEELCKLLYKKPLLTVTNEGVLVFYTPTTLIATLDCKCGNVIEVNEFAKAVGNNYITNINSVSVASDGSNVIKFDTRIGKSVQYKLTMLFDFFSDEKVTVKIN